MSWIKVRVTLLTSPQLVRISSATCLDRVRTLGALVSAFIVFDTHSVDGNMAGYTYEALDEVVGLPGLAQAMEDVGWLRKTPQGIEMIDFQKHNGASAKRRALDSDRKKNVRKMSASEEDVLRTKSKREKESKSKKENNNPPNPPDGGNQVRSKPEPEKLGAPLFGGPALQAAWLDFVEHRKQMKKPLTNLSAKKIAEVLYRSYNEGYCPVAMLNKSVANGWQGVFPAKPGDALRSDAERRFVC
jgi:hypothetical protein